MYIPSAPIRKAGREHAKTISARCIHEPRYHVHDREDDQHTDVVPCERASEFPHVRFPVTRRSDSIVIRSIALVRLWHSPHGHSLSARITP
jgi:hypothetical protein